MISSNQPAKLELLAQIDDLDPRDDSQAIIDICSATVEYSDIMVDVHGNKKSYPKFASWGLSWKYGGISWTSSKGWTEKQAKGAAAMFLYLWLKGVGTSIAVRLSEMYGNHLERRTGRKAGHEETKE